MPSEATDFNHYRPRLFGIAYRMLGTRSDAEDVLQDAYLRWHHADTSSLDTPEAWLVTVVTRLCIDHLRKAKRERETYPGEWLPEPLISAQAASAEETIELAGDISLAYLRLLERLSPEERAAFLLREVFEYDYPAIGQILEKSQEACRQIVHRARKHLQAGRTRYSVDRQAHLDLLSKFVSVAYTGNIDALKTLFAEDIRLISDGGGKATAVNRILYGPERIARLYYAVSKRLDGLRRFEIMDINNEPGLVAYRNDNGDVESVILLMTDGQAIHEIYTVRNPDKLSLLTLH
ncbi:MAG: RNA polymerase sigma-70 factor [Gammaproteobacteria bacterium]|jgi:RNA polymerase sigma-70 factor (ECF subfamily)